MKARSIRSIVIGTLVASVLELAGCSNSYSCSEKNPCTGVVPTETAITQCNTLLSAACGSQYQAYLNCAQNNYTCSEPDGGVTISSACDNQKDDAIGCCLSNPSACSESTSTSTTGTGSGGASSGSSGATGGTTTTSGGGGWTTIPVSVPPYADGGANLNPPAQIAAIWMDSVSRGVVATNIQGGNLGNLLEVNGTTISSTNLFDGGDVPSPTAPIFDAFADSPYGLIALNDQNLLIARPTGQTGFLVAPTNLPPEDQTPEYWLAPDSSGTWLAFTGGSYANLLAATSTPNGSTVWSQVWNSDTFSTLADGGPECGYGSFAPGYGATGLQVYVSPDGGHIVFPNNAATGSGGVCISTNGGLDFYPLTFPSSPDGGGTPSAIADLIVSSEDGSHVLLLNTDQLSAEVSADYGVTWRRSAVPLAQADANTSVRLVAAFFAPDDQHVWIVGISSTAGIPNVTPLLYASSNGGTTFTDISGSLAAFDQYEFTAGFALDANHIWLGATLNSNSDDPVAALLYSSSGGQ